MNMNYKYNDTANRRTLYPSCTRMWWVSELWCSNSLLQTWHLTRGCSRCVRMCRSMSGALTLMLHTPQVCNTLRVRTGTMPTGHMWLDCEQQHSWSQMPQVCGRSWSCTRIWCVGCICLLQALQATLRPVLPSGSRSLEMSDVFLSAISSLTSTSCTCGIRPRLLLSTGRWTSDLVLWDVDVLSASVAAELTSTSCTSFTVQNTN